MEATHMQTQIKTRNNGQKSDPFDGSIVVLKPFQHKTLEERASAYGGSLDPDGEFDWGEPKEREIW